MITQQDLKEAIAECQGQRDPNANTCIKLAAFLTIQRELYGSEDVGVPPRSFSYSPGIEYDSETEFAQAIRGRTYEEIMPIIDELMTTLNAVYPRLYDSVIRELS